MKTLFTTLLIILISTSLSWAQRFKMTGFTANSKKFDDTESHVLGKPLILEVYDTSVSVKIAEEKPIIVHKTSENTYSVDLTKPNSNDNETLTVKLNKLVGYITSVEVVYWVKSNTYSYKEAYFKITAKRD